jgi:ribose transport system permease protein
MSDLAKDRDRGALMFVPKSPFLIWLNLAITLIIAGIGFGLGFAQGLSAQIVILYTVISIAVLFWAINYITVVFEARQGGTVVKEEVEGQKEAVGAKGLWRGNRVLIIVMALMLVVYLILTASLPAFRTIQNLIAFLLLEAILIFAFSAPSRSTASCRVPTSRRCCCSQPFSASPASARPWSRCWAASICRSPS